MCDVVCWTQEAAAAFSVLQSALDRQLDSALPGGEQNSGASLQIASSAADLLKAAEEERAAFDSMLKDVASLLTPESDNWLEPGSTQPEPTLSDAADTAQPVPAYVTMLHEIGRLRRSLAVLVMTWAATLHDPVVYARPVSHSHSAPHSLHSLQGSGAHVHQLSTDSLPDMTCDDAPLQIATRHAAVEQAELAQQALHADESSASSAASSADTASETDSVDSRTDGIVLGQQTHNTISSDRQEPQTASAAQQEEPHVDQIKPCAKASSGMGGIVAQTILNLERQNIHRSPPTRMNAAAAARRFVASALEQRARTLQWLNSSKLSADEVGTRAFGTCPKFWCLIHQRSVFVICSSWLGCT